MQLKEFENWFEIIKHNDDVDEQLAFVWALMKSPFAEYHYLLLKNKAEINPGFWSALCSRFGEHNEDGELLLLSKLDKNEDVEMHADIIFMLGKNKGKHTENTLKYARILAESDDDYKRDRAIIVLGWIGKIQDIKILEQHLLYDSNANCRAWSASAFMQMWMRRKSDGLKQSAFKSFNSALKQEKNNLVLATIIAATQEIGQKRFNITQKSLDNLDEAAIKTAVSKAIKYLDKNYASF